MCNCYDRITKLLEEKVKADAPPGSENFSIEIQGFLFGFREGGVTHRSSNAVKIAFTAPKKSGGTKLVRQNSFVRASFCPFCGESYEKAEAA